MTIPCRIRSRDTLYKSNTDELDYMVLLSMLGGSAHRATGRAQC